MEESNELNELTEENSNAKINLKSNIFKSNKSKKKIIHFKSESIDVNESMANNYSIYVNNLNPKSVSNSNSTTMNTKLKFKLNRSVTIKSNASNKSKVNNSKESLTTIKVKIPKLDNYINKPQIRKSNYDIMNDTKREFVRKKSMKLVNSSIEKRSNERRIEIEENIHFTNSYSKQNLNLFKTLILTPKPKIDKKNLPLISDTKIKFRGNFEKGKIPYSLNAVINDKSLTAFTHDKSIRLLNNENFINNINNSYGIVVGKAVKQKLYEKCLSSLIVNKSFNPSNEEDNVKKIINLKLKIKKEPYKLQVLY